MSNTETIDAGVAALPSSDTFSASINLPDGANVHVIALSLEVLAATIAKLKATPATPIQFPAITPSPGVSADEKQAVMNSGKAEKPKDTRPEKETAGNGTQSAGQQSADLAGKPSTASTSGDASAKPMDYAEVKKAVVALYGKSPKDAEAIVTGEFGVKRADALPAEKWPALVERLKAKLAELEAVPA